MNLSKKPMSVTEFKKIAESDDYKTPKYESYDDLDRTFWRTATLGESKV